MKANFKSHSFWILLILIAVVGCSKDTNDDDSESTGNNLSLGISANDLLSQENYSSMRVEVLHEKNAAPSEATLKNIGLFLEDHTYKPNGIKVYSRAIEATDDNEFSISEVKEIETENRSAFNSGDEIAVFILFVDGKSEGQKDNKLVLGTAYKNTSMVIFSATVQQLAKSSGISKSEIESTTIKHEFGHLFGLVDNGSPAQSDHEDSESKSHCNVESCVMVAAMEFGSGTLKMLKNTTGVGFDETCLRDLRANGGK